MQGASRRCRLKRFEFPRYWEEIAEEIESADQLIQRMKDLLSEFSLGDADGVAFFLEDSGGNILNVCCSDEGWVISSDPKGGAGVISVGNKSATGYKAFLSPEWTDIERKHLVPSDVARAAVKLWVETGQLSHSIEWME